MLTVMTNGCFDLLHAGHVDFLRRCRLLGDHLVVAINSDQSVQRLKGSGRPIYSQHERICIVSALRYVSEVHVFDTEEELSELVKRIQPDVLVKGGDYAGRDVTGAGHARRLVLLPLVPGHSTSQTIARLR
jgi:D-beta-D-heptose 7-phosphate kinase/D-beta-D-heptose 1-phosphate adenosyltransferase